MKKTIVFTLMALLLVVPALATSVYYEDFESGVLDTEWAVYNDAANRDWTVLSDAPYNGTYNAEVWGTGSGDNAYLEGSIDTTGHTNLNLSYYRQLVGMDGTDDFIVEWSDGTFFYTLEQLGGASENGNYEYRSYILPAGAENNPDFSIRFTCQAGAVSEFCRVDDIQLQSTTTTTPPQTPNDGGFGITISGGTSGFNIIFNPQYNNGTENVTVNRTLVPSDEPTYEWGVNDGIYEAHFQNLPSTTSAILLRRGIDIAYDPDGLYFWSTAGDDIIDANPNGEGDPDPNDPTTMLYPDAYGTGIDLSYTYLADELKEIVTVDNRLALGTPTSVTEAGDNLSVMQQFQFRNLDDADLYVDGVLVSGAQNIEFAKEAYLMFNGTKVFVMTQPYGFDSNGSEVYGWYRFEILLNSITVQSNFPYEWINNPNTTYPIYLDPTTQVEIEDTVVINLSDPQYAPVRQIILYNVSDNGDNTLYYDNYNHSQDEEEWKDLYAIDPSHVDFTTGIVETGNATGRTLYKCVDYNYTTQTCYGEWVLTDTELTPGEPYNFTIDAIDPAFGEGNAIIAFDATAINATTIIQAYYDDNLGQIRSQVLDYSGTVIVNATTIDTGVDEKSRIGVSMIDSTSWVIGWYNNDVKDLLIRTYHINGTPLTSEVIIDATGSDRSDIDVFTLGDKFGTCFLDGVEELAGFVIYNNDGTVNVSRTNFATTTRTQNNPDHAIECSSLTNNLWIVSWYQRNTEAVRYALYNSTGGAVVTSSLLTSLGEKAEVAVSGMRDGTYGILIHSENTNAVNLFIRKNGASIATITVDTNANTDGKVSLTTVKSNESNDEYFVTVWNDQQADQVRGAVYNATGGVVTSSFLIASNPDATQVDVAGEGDPNKDFDFCRSTYVASWLSQATGTAQYQVLNIDGTNYTGGGTCIYTESGICDPYLDEEWIIDYDEVCDNVTRTTGTGTTTITSEGSLTLINDAEITTSGMPLLTRVAGLWKILIERGSELIIQ